MQPLAIDVAQFGSDESNIENIRINLQRGLPEFAPTIVKNDGVFVIVGSGPSMPAQIDRIKIEVDLGRPICAINGANDFLIENGITPDLFVTCDPRPMPQNFKNPGQETIYLLASRCHPSSFERLKDHKVMLWHSWSHEKECAELRGRLVVGGGTTSGLRAVNLGYVMGFRKFRLYGFDSCLKDKTVKRFTGEKAGQLIDVIVNGEVFWCNAAGAQQARDFQYLYKIFHGINIEALGGGLIAAIIEARKSQGLPT